MTLLKETNEEIGVTVLRCDVCGQVDPANDHSCKSIVDPKLHARENDINYIFTALGDEKIEAKEKIRLLNAYQDTLEWIWQNRQFPAIEKKFSFGIVRSHIYKRICWMIDRLRAMQESCYDEYKKLIREGISLHERRKKINHFKIDWCKKKEIEYLLLLKSFKVKPFSEWLAQGDFESIKRFGFGEFINYNLENIIYVEDKKR